MSITIWGQKIPTVIELSMLWVDQNIGLCLLLLVGDFVAVVHFFLPWPTFEREDSLLGIEAFDKLLIVFCFLFPLEIGLVYIVL